MKTYNEFLDEVAAGTYVSLRFDLMSNETLHTIAMDLGITPIKEFHVTVVYSPEGLGVPLGSSKVSGEAKVTGIKYLGEKDSEYRAIVLELKSDIALERHNHYIDKYDYVHSYDEFIQHVSLGYRPPENLDLSEVDIGSIPTLTINKEIVEKLK